MGVSRENAGPLDGGTNFAEIFSNALPHSLEKSKEKSSDSSVSVNNSIDILKK